MFHSLWLDSDYVSVWSSISAYHLSTHLSSLHPSSHLPFININSWFLIFSVVYNTSQTWPVRALQAASVSPWLVPTLFLSWARPYFPLTHLGPTLPQISPQFLQGGLIPFSFHCFVSSIQMSSERGEWSLNELTLQSQLWDLGLPGSVSGTLHGLWVLRELLLHINYV